jgi:hypothetical protein
MIVAREDKSHDVSVEAGLDVAFELAHRGAGERADEVVKDLRYGRVLAFAPGTAKLGGVQQTVVNLVVHCPTSE